MTDDKTIRAGSDIGFRLVCAGLDRAERGGSWDLSPQWARVADSDCSGPAYLDGDLGFRLARDKEEQ